MELKKITSFFTEKSSETILEKLIKRKKIKEKNKLRTANLKHIKEIEAKYGVDFGGYIPDTAALGTSSELCNGYEPAYPMPEVFKYLNINEGDKLLDVGSGKGYAMYMFSSLPFERIDGVELSERLAELSKENLGKIFPQEQNRFKIFCENALSFEHLDDYNYIFMYNPFPRDVVGQFVDKLSESAKNRDNKLTVIYQNPQRGALFEQSGAFKTVLMTDGTAVFESII